MSIKKIEQTKSSKFFAWSDLIIYGCILVAIVVLFLLFALPSSRTLVSEKSVVEVKTASGIVLTFDFGTNKHTSSGDDIEITPHASGITAKITTSGTYNTLKFDTSGDGKVTMESATCSLHHDCTMMSITRTSDNIICLPNNIYVYVLGSEPILSTG